MHTEIVYKYSYGSCLTITSPLPVCVIVCSHSFFMFIHKKLWSKTRNFCIASPSSMFMWYITTYAVSWELLFITLPVKCGSFPKYVFNKWCSPQRSLVSGYYWYHVRVYWVSKLFNYFPFYITRGGGLCECIANGIFEPSPLLLSALLLSYNAPGRFEYGRWLSHSPLHGMALS